MQYRPFGKLNFQVSALGFGAMRLPMKEEGEKKVVDEAEAIRMMRYAIDQGVNYIDTAHVYHDGDSEIVVGKALQDGYRDKVKIATKMPIWLAQETSDLDKYLNEELERLQTNHIEFYLIHAIWKNRWQRVQDLNVLKWADKAIADGRIGHLCFSYHDDTALFKEVIDAYDWAMCQIQYNYMNEDVQAGTEGLEYAAKKGMAVVIMEPLLGGLLVRPPMNVKPLWEKAGKKPVDMALQWLWNKPEISTVLSGMSTMEQVQQNIASAEQSGINSLTAADIDLMQRVRNAYESAQSIPCTKRGYCMPCPQGVNIPRNFELYNEGTLYENPGTSTPLYNWHFPEQEKASNCIDCGVCLEKCPQNIPINEWMPKVHAALAAS
jgi:uncharacterized protein